MAASATGRALTEAHRRAQIALQAALTRDLRAFWRRFDLEDIDGSWELIRPAVEALVQSYRRRSAVLSGAYLERFAAAEGAEPPEIRPAPDLSDEEMARNLTLTGPITAKKLITKGGGNVAQRTLASLAGSAQRLAANGGRDTIHATVAASPKIAGWYRVTDGNPCAFCAMVAGLGVHYKSRQTATRTGGGDKYHDRCGCTAEPVFVGVEHVPPETTERYQELWRDATKGKSGAEARKAFRRAHEGR